MNEQLLREYIKEHIRNILETKPSVNEDKMINGHKVQLVDTVEDQDENFAENYVVFLIDDEFLVIFAVVVGKDVPGANYKGEGNMEVAAKYWIPGDLVIGMKDELDQYANGPTPEAKETLKSIFRELAVDAEYNLGIGIPNDITLDPEDFEYGDLSTIF